MKHSKRLYLIWIFACFLAATIGCLSADAQPFAYVSNLGSNTVSVIDTATNTVVATVPVGNGPSGVAITPNGAFAYVKAAGRIKV